MNQISYKLATWLMWVALPITAVCYGRVWDDLPLRMAVHFDADWQPNGYTSREGALILGLGVMAFLLIVFTVAAHLAQAIKPRAAWPVLVTFYVALILLTCVNNGIVEFNLKSYPPHSESVRFLLPSQTRNEFAAVKRVL